MIILVSMWGREGISSSLRLSGLSRGERFASDLTSSCQAWPSLSSRSLMTDPDH
jgi:hypothetical protein